MFEVLVKLKSDIAVIIFIKSPSYPGIVITPPLESHNKKSEYVLFESGREWLSFSRPSQVHQWYPATSFKIFNHEVKNQDKFKDHLAKNLL